MAEDNSSAEQKTNVRLGRSIPLTTAVAIGSSFTVGLSIYYFLGPIYNVSGNQTPASYALMLFFSLPLILALAERSSVTPGHGGLFNLSRAAGSVPLAFSTGWLLLGGLFALAALFAWEGGSALSQLLSLFFNLQIESNWLGVLLIILVLLLPRSRQTDVWRIRRTIVFAAIILLFVIFLRAWLSPIEIPPTWIYLPSSTLLPVLPYLGIGLWGLHFVLDRRDHLRRARRGVFPALLLPALIGALAGIAVSAALLLYPPLSYAESFPLVLLAETMQPLLAFLVVLAMFLFGIFGLNESLSSFDKLSAALVDDGFLPEHLKLRRQTWRRSLYTYLLFTIITCGIVLGVNTIATTTISTWALSLAFILVNVQDMLRSQPRLAGNRWPKLPFHPLVPGLAVALSITFIVLGLNLDHLFTFMPWLVVGMLIYFFYARRGAITVRQRDALVTDAVLPAKKSNFRVLVAISDPDRAPSLIRLGSQIADAHDGEVAVLRIIQRETDEASEQRRAIAAWQRLSELINSQEKIQVSLIPMVRLADDAAQGILTTIWEEKIDIVLLGWPADKAPDIHERDGTIRQIVRKAQCQVVVLHGSWLGTAQNFLVPMVSAGHSLAALSLSQNLSHQQETGSRIVALHIIPGKLTEEKKEQADRQLAKTCAQLDKPAGIEAAIVSARDAKKGILQESSSYDALLLGLSDEGFLAETNFSGLPLEVALDAVPPTLLVKRREKSFQYWLRRSWDELDGVLPTLTRKRRTVVGAEMHGDARADTDFYFLMVMAASIALLGLLQNSAAVIIGAMLVAPLMSPILAMSHSVVRGQLGMLREAARSTVNGIVLAITVAALLSLALLALGFSIVPTSEILARTEPNFLDLLIALASGAAAAYAISRSEVSAALPGVAIAAALVPPLAVVGYSLGTAQFDLAAGSLLLFLTNLAAIVLAAAVIFLLLGFRPPATSDDRDEQARFGLKMAVVALVLVAIPLFATTRTSAIQTERNETIYRTLEQKWPPSQAQVVDIRVSQQWNEDLKVSCTIFDYRGGVTEQAIAQLQIDLSDAIGEPVQLSARTIDASLTNMSEAGAKRILTTTPAPTEAIAPSATMSPEEIDKASAPVSDLIGTTTPNPVKTSQPDLTPAFLEPAIVTVTVTP